MQEVNKHDVLEVLNQVGVGAGDGLLVHSALQFLGRPEGGVGIYLEALQQAVGPQGTLIVPAFNFSFAKGEDFDPATALAVGMGTFSEYVRLAGGVKRTSHPMQSFAVWGRDVDALTKLDTPSAFDDNSAVDWALKNEYKLLLLGADIQAASILHYSEQRAKVPYRYWKEFSGRVLRDGKWQPCSYSMFVRDMEIDARLEIYPIQDKLESEEKWADVELNYGLVSLCSLKDFVRVTDQLLADDPWCFVTNRPEGV
ncbi:MAG: AAC(3) family N-acetyltransferase [Chloroflexota bacterium]